MIITSLRRRHGTPHRDLGWLTVAITVLACLAGHADTCPETVYPPHFYASCHQADTAFAQGRYADAVDSYRHALGYVPVAVITTQPVPYARALHQLARTLHTLRRYTDAEAVLVAAGGLVDALPVESDMHFTRCVQAARMYDWDTAAAEAEKCIEIDPDISKIIRHCRDFEVSKFLITNLFYKVFKGEVTVEDGDSKEVIRDILQHIPNTEPYVKYLEDAFSGEPTSQTTATDILFHLAMHATTLWHNCAASQLPALFPGQQCRHPLSLPSSRSFLYNLPLPICVSSEQQMVQ